MVSESLHPGACAVSEAVLCAGDQAPQVLAWIFDHQQELRDLGARDPGQLAARIRQDLPQLAGCLGKPETQGPSEPLAALGGVQLAAGPHAADVRPQPEDLPGGQRPRARLRALAGAGRRRDRHPAGRGR